MVRFRHPYGWITVAIVLLVGVSIGLASKSGAQAGRSGGRIGFGSNCTWCHGYNLGTGRLEILGAPQRYRAGRVYDLTVRITAPEQDGAGFQLSAEGVGAHVGELLVAGSVRTRLSGGSVDYLTHTRDGVDDSIAAWVAAGGVYDYSLQWRAPDADEGVVTFFAAANAIDNDEFFSGVRYYATHRISHYARPGDFDGDNDIALDDHERFVACLVGPGAGAATGCDDGDADGDGDVDLMDLAAVQVSFTGSNATVPGAYLLADSVRGGQLYDKWWLVTGAPPPVGDHPLYPAIGQQTGSATYRCKECHGWDYKGRDGAYALGSSHFTDISGVSGTGLTPQALFDLLKADPASVAGGHDLDAFGLADDDLWDVVKMVLEGTIDTDAYIDGGGAFLGDGANGAIWYGDAEPGGEMSCAACHGLSGDKLNFADPANPEFVGTVANQNPWEFLHKVRFAHPGSPMSSTELLLWDIQIAADIGAYAATLPQ